MSKKMDIQLKYNIISRLKIADATMSTLKLGKKDFYI